MTDISIATARGITLAATLCVADTADPLDVPALDAALEADRDVPARSEGVVVLAHDFLTDRHGLAHRLDDLAARYLSPREQQKIMDTVEGWLHDAPQDAALLLHLGQMAYAKQLWGKAQGYLEASLQAQATPQARLVLAKVFDEMDKPKQAEQQRQLVLSEITPEDDETAAE